MSGKTSTVRLYKEKTKAQPSKELMDLVRKQAMIKNRIIKALEKGPKTIPEIASEIGLPIHEVTWYVLTFTKYNILRPVEQTDEGYWKYEVVK
ncbi:hypothetical protein DRJ19_05530 [Candidatus Woesearchaeota archaeon]|nr:MAG: hypothetical protein DRJ19_05530 [Candidatus Woesearchaeota archaeon]